MRDVNTVEIDGHICTTEIEYRMTVVYLPTGNRFIYYADRPRRFYEVGTILEEVGNHTAVIDAILHCYVDGKLVNDIEFAMSEF